MLSIHGCYRISNRDGILTWFSFLMWMEEKWKKKLHNMLAIKEWFYGSHTSLVTCWYSIDFSIFSRSYNFLYLEFCFQFLFFFLFPCLVFIYLTFIVLQSTIFQLKLMNFGWVVLSHPIYQHSLIIIRKCDWYYFTCFCILCATVFSIAWLICNCFHFLISSISNCIVQ